MLAAAILQWTLPFCIALCSVDLFGSVVEHGLVLDVDDDGGLRDRSFFYEGGGAGGIWEVPFKNRMTPLSLPIFSHVPPYSAHFLG